MRTVGYRLVDGSGRPLNNLFFPEPLVNVHTGEPFPDQQEAVLRSEAEEAIALAREATEAFRADCDKWIDSWRVAERNRANWQNEAEHYLDELTKLKSGSRFTRALRILFTGK